MSSAATPRDRRGFFDLVAQLRRRWFVVVGGGLIGLVVAVALSQVVGGLRDASYLTVLIGVVAGLILGFVAGIALVHLQPRVTTADDVRRVTGLPVIAQLPSAVLDVDDLDDDSPSRRLRTSLREVVMNTRSLAGGSLPRRLVFARTDSAVEAAGVDVGIARALVESGFVPALVETDLEAGMVTRPTYVGDSARIADPSPLGDEALGAAPTPETTSYQSVAVPDRIAAARPVDRLSAVEGLLGTLGERYDVTVAQASSESFPVPLRSIAPIADAVLIVVRSNRTTVESLLSLYGELLSIGVQPLGVVMTAVAGRHRVLLRNTWAPSDFRDIAVPAAAAAEAPESPVDLADEALPDPSPRAGFSIADLATRATASASSGSSSARSSAPSSRKDQS